MRPFLSVGERARFNGTSAAIERNKLNLAAFQRSCRNSSNHAAARSGSLAPRFQRVRSKHRSSVETIGDTLTGVSFLPSRSTRSRPSRKHKLSFLFVSLNRRGNFSGEIVDRAPSKWRKEDFLCWRGKKKQGKGGKRRIDDYEARTNRAGLPTDFSG